MIVLASRPGDEPGTGRLCIEFDVNDAFWVASILENLADPETDDEQRILDQLSQEVARGLASGACRWCGHYDALHPHS